MEVGPLLRPPPSPLGNGGESGCRRHAAPHCAASVLKPTIMPAPAAQICLKKAGMTKNDIDLFEINEAFSCVTMACTALAKIDPARVNVRGGAVALGHPIGASGARILTTLLYALADEGKKRGLATLCIGGSMGIAMCVERD